MGDGHSYFTVHVLQKGGKFDSEVERDFQDEDKAEKFITVLTDEFSKLKIVTEVFKSIDLDVNERE